jgi:hypothetical protein
LIIIFVCNQQVYGGDERSNSATDERAESKPEEEDEVEGDEINGEEAEDERDREEDEVEGDEINGEEAEDERDREEDEVEGDGINGEEAEDERDREEDGSEDDEEEVEAETTSKKSGFTKKRFTPGNRSVLGVPSARYMEEIVPGQNGVPKVWLRSPIHARKYVTFLYEDILRASSKFSFEDICSHISLSIIFVYFLN